MWGRFDQMFGNIHELHRADNQRVYLITEDSLIMALTVVSNPDY